MALRHQITFRVMREHDNTVADVVFYRVNIPIGGVNPNAAVELNVGLRTGNHTLRFGARSAGRRIVEPVEYPDTPRVAVLKKHFVESGVDGDRSVNRIL